MTVGRTEVEIVKPRTDKREYRRIVLPNSLEALLISDPETDKAAASMVVSVGSFSNPEGLEGLAHFLEHMLFYASEKYPIEDSYSKYIAEHGGSRNAYTSSEHTNYYFDISADHLEEALDRFAQFFIKPLISSDATLREIKAVDSENQKNLLSDHRRIHQLKKHISKEDHPFHKFGTGNWDTLEVLPKAKGIDTREELIKFYEEHYSANLMHLVVYGKGGLDEIQSTVEEKFTDVPNTEQKYFCAPDQPCAPQHVQIVVKAVPIKQGHDLQILWPISPSIKNYKSGPCIYLSHLIGHEGNGSLYFILKALGWAIDLSAGEQDSSDEFSFFYVGIKLTDIGYASSDILKNATSVLGGEATLRNLHMKLLQVAGNCKNLESCDWQSVEAIFYCIQSIAKSIPLQESEIMPQIIISLISNFPNKPLLLQTICLTIGAYSKWLNAAPLEISNLHAVINILTRGMSMSEESAAAASIAFKYICEDCRQKLCASLDDLFKIYHIVISGKGNFKVSSDDAIHFVGALSSVITELPPDNAKQGLELLCIPIVTSLKELTNQSPSSFRQINAFQITIHIDRLACIFRFVKHPQLIADTVHMCWPVFKAIFDERPWDMRTMECLCRACKYAVRTSGKYMGTTISAMLEEVQALYKQHSQSCFLYLSSEVIKIFGSDPSCASYLQCLIVSLFGHTIQLLTKIQDFTARPDIADDCFLLASRCIRYCPELFVPSPIFSPLITCAMIGITIQHRDACKSILTFMSDVFDLANASSGNKYRSIIDSAILPRGAALTRIMIASLTGALPSSRLDEVSYVLLAFSRSHGIYFVEWAKSSISLIPSSVLTETERLSFTKALADSNSRSDASSFNSTLDELCDVCRLNRSVQEIVQDALRPHDLNLPTVSLPQ